MADEEIAKKKQPRRGRRLQGPTTPDPVEIAMEAEAHDASNDSPARVLLTKQAALIDAQCRSENFGAALKVLTGLAGIAAALVLVAMAYASFQDQSLSIGAVDAPPDFAARGLSGKVLAGQIQDRLLAMQQETAALDSALTVKGERTGGVSVDVLDTTVSLGEVQRLLDSWLSRRTVVTTALSRVAGGVQDGALSIDVRVGGNPGVRLVQADGDLDALIGRAAEAVFRQARPLRFVNWLDQHGRTEEAVAVGNAIAREGTPQEQARALLLLVNYQPILPRSEKLRLLSRATELDPNLANAWNNLALTFPVSERGLQLLIRARRTQKVKESAFSAAVLDHNINAVRGDVAATLRHHCENYGIEPCSMQALTAEADLSRYRFRADDGQAETRLPALALQAVRHHDALSARLILARPRIPPPGRSDAYWAQVGAAWLNSEVVAALDREDFTGALRALNALPPLSGEGVERPNLDRRASQRADALAGLGRLGEARAALDAADRVYQPLGLDCQFCTISRASIAAQAGDAALADRLFADASAKAPSIPQADAAWGKALIARGEPGAAIARLKIAHQRSPHFPDALELWGEALLAKGDTRGAAKKFALAAKDAPRWGRLHLMWAKALSGQGNTDEARAHRATAAGLFLTAAERAELDALKL